MTTFEQFINYAIAAANEKDRRERNEIPLHQFRISKAASSLVRPATDCALHHREREKHYTTELEKAEKKLKEQGVTVEIIDPKTGAAFATPGGDVSSLASGSISLVNFNVGNMASIPKFQPKINQEMLGDVERAKTKMLEHRAKAEQFEKWARAFRCSPPDLKVELSIEDIHTLKLES